MYGGGFATLPAFLGDLFGTKQLGAIHGLVLASWAIAGVAGPTIYDVVKESTGSLEITLKVFSSLFVVAFVISLLMKRLVNNAYKLKDKAVA
jgi:OFA family oxalate/formate antiporter-like MFS transporter